MLKSFTSSACMHVDTKPTPEPVTPTCVQLTYGLVCDYWKVMSCILTSAFFCFVLLSVETICIDLLAGRTESQTVFVWPLWLI